MNDTATLTSDEFLHELVEYMVPWGDLATSPRVPAPQQIADMIAESMEDDAATPQSEFIVARLRNGDANAYIAGRLGLA